MTTEYNNNCNNASLDDLMKFTAADAYARYNQSYDTQLMEAAYQKTLLIILTRIHAASLNADTHMILASDWTAITCEYPSRYRAELLTAVARELEKRGFGIHLSSSTMRITWSSAK